MEECGGICGKQLFFGCFLLSGNSFFCSFQLGGVMLEDTCFFLLFVFECMCVYVLYVSSLYLPGSHCEKVVKFVHIYILYIFTYALFKYAKKQICTGNPSCLAHQRDFLLDRTWLNVTYFFFSFAFFGCKLLRFHLWKGKGREVGKHAFFFTAFSVCV